jgi:PII-like signaling protein
MTAKKEFPMSQSHKAVKVSIHLQEGTTYHGTPLQAAILDFLLFRGIPNAAIFKGTAGFGPDHRMHSATTVEISDKLPLRIEFIEDMEKVSELLGKLQEMAGSSMIEMQETTLIQAPRSSRKQESRKQEHVKIEGKAKLMRIYIGESDKWHDQPLHEVLVRAMRANDLAGVTVYKAIMGYGAHRRIHKDKPMHLSRDASMMLSVVDSEEKLRAFLTIVEEMIVEGLVTFSDVDVIKYSHRAVTEEEQG